MPYGPLAVMKIDDLVYPISYRWHLDTPFGATQVELTVDGEGIDGFFDGAPRLGELLFMAAIAPAIHHNVSCRMIESMVWKEALVPTITFPQGVQGLRFGGRLGREHGVCLVLHSGDHDSLALQRIIIPTPDPDWVEGGLLTVAGAEQLQTLARGWVYGMTRIINGSDLRLLIMHPNVVPSPLKEVKRPGFRDVQYIRVLQHTERVPEQGPVDWP